MRVNTMARDNERKFDYSKWMMYAIVSAFVCYLFLDILVKILIVVFGLLVKYWWATLILFLVVVFIRRGRNQHEHPFR